MNSNNVPPTSRRWFVSVHHPTDHDVARLRTWKSKYLRFSCGAFDPLDESVEAVFCFSTPVRIGTVKRILPAANWEYKQVPFNAYQNNMAEKPGYWCQGDIPRQGLRYGFDPKEYVNPDITNYQLSIRAQQEIEYWQNVLKSFEITEAMSKKQIEYDEYKKTVCLQFLNIARNCDIGDRNVNIEEVDDSKEDSTIVP